MRSAPGAVALLDAVRRATEQFTALVRAVTGDTGLCEVLEDRGQVVVGEPAGERRPDAGRQRGWAIPAPDAGGA